MAESKKDISNIEILKLVFKISKYLKKKRLFQFNFLVILVFICSFFEVVTLGAVIPFISILINPEIVSNSKYFIYFDNIFNITSIINLSTLFVLIFISLVIASAFLRLSLNISMIKFSRLIGKDLSENVFKNIISQNYLFHLNNPSNEIISGLTLKITITTRIFLSLLNIFSSIFLITSIFIALIFVNSTVAVSVILVLFVSYLFVILRVKNIYLMNSSEIAKQQNNVVRIIQESLGSIRDIIIDSKQKFYIKNYIDSFDSLQKANQKNTIYNQSPKYIIEMLALVLISIFILRIGEQSGGLVSIMPSLGAIALAGQRMLPMAQMVYSSWSNINSSYNSLEDIYYYLTLKHTNAGAKELVKMPFSDSIELKNITFKYSKEDKEILKNINLKISKGTRLGIIGKTGSGKSTLIDILSGLLMQSNGSVLIDNNELDLNNIHNWQKNISYVPQSTFLFNSSIKNNIIMSNKRENYNENRLLEALKKSQLDKFVETLDNGFDTVVGEKGSKLSGGQKQRIAIARAIYKNSSVLIFDESTSALDEQTERELISEIYSLRNNITIIMVSHRKTILSKCDQIIEIVDGKIQYI